MRIQTLMETPRQDLYHSTSVQNALSILDGGSLSARTQQVIDGKKIMGISTTRDKRFAIKWNPVTLELDATAIGFNHKIIPVDFLAHKSHFKVKPRDNSEEFIVGSLNHLEKYVKTVYLDNRVYQSSHYDDLLDVLNDKYRNVEIKYL